MPGRNRVIRERWKVPTSRSHPTRFGPKFKIPPSILYSNGTQNVQATDRLTTLPFEIVERIFKNLETGDRIALSLTNKHLAQIAMMTFDWSKRWESWFEAYDFMTSLSFPRTLPYAYCGPCWIWRNAFTSFPSCNMCGNGTLIWVTEFFDSSARRSFKLPHDGHPVPGRQVLMSYKRLCTEIGETEALLKMVKMLSKGVGLRLVRKKEDVAQNDRNEVWEWVD